MFPWLLVAAHVRGQRGGEQEAMGGDTTKGHPYMQVLTQKVALRLSQMHGPAPDVLNWGNCNGVLVGEVMGTLWVSRPISFQT